jgi:hypothetical protein
MKRRQFLATGTALLSVTLAGCGHPSVVLDMDDASAADIADEVSMMPDSGTEEYAIIQSALENGSATRTGSYELFDRTNVVRVNDSFYEVSETRLKESEVTVYEVLVDLNPENTAADRGEIAFGDLPETDRQRLEPVLSDEDPPEQERYNVGVDYGSEEELEGESVFVPERKYDILVHDGNRYRIAVNSRTAAEAEYRYEVTEVESGVEAYAQQVRDRYQFALTGLSAEERQVVEEAVDGGYFEETDAFRSVVDRIREHEGIREEDFYGTWLIEYEGVDYITYAEW